MASGPPKVLISYSHDSAEHARRVLALAERLRRDGVDAQLDQYVAGTPTEGWPRWMLDQLDWADFILSVCTETYYRRFRGHEEPGQGKGVDFEGHLITLAIYHAKSRTERFVPILFEPKDERFIPEPVLGHTHYLLSSEDNYARMYAFLTGQAGVVPAELGPLKTRAREAVQPLSFGSAEASGKRHGVARLRGACDPGVFLPSPPHDFVGRSETLEILYAALAENLGSALLHGEPGCGKSTLALKFAWVGQGAFDALVFQLCGQRPVATVAAELAARLKLGVETRPPEEQVAAVKAWLAERRTLVVLDDIWENDVRALIPGPPVSLLCTSRRRSLPWVAVAHSLEVKSFSRDEAERIFGLYLGEETLGNHRDVLLEFAEKVERLPIALVVGADLLRRELDPVPEAARGLRLEKLRNEVHDVDDLLRRAITARPEQERRLLYAMAICSPEGFWLPLAVQMAGLSEAEGREVRNRLVDASLVRLLDRDRQRFQLHGLLREALRNLAPVGDLQAAHAGVLEGLFRHWEGGWCECRECLAEVIPAVQYLWQKNESSRAARLSYWGFATGQRVGEMEIALRIVQKEEALCRELGNKDGLQRSYGNQALILRAWGRLEEALALLKKQEALCREVGNKDDLQSSYGHQARILHTWGRLEEALALLKKQETLCRELDTKAGLQASYGHQAMILHAWGRLEEALALLKEQEALCRELDTKNGLQWSYSNQAVILRTWGRLEEALALFKKQEASAGRWATKTVCGGAAPIRR